MAFWAPREGAARFEALVVRVGLVYTLGVGRFGSGDVKLGAE